MTYTATSRPTTDQIYALEDQAAYRMGAEEAFNELLRFIGTDLAADWCAYLIKYELIDAPDGMDADFDYVNGAWVWYDVDDDEDEDEDD